MGRRKPADPQHQTALAHPDTGRHDAFASAPDERATPPEAEPPERPGFNPNNPDRESEAARAMRESIRQDRDRGIAMD